MNYHVPKPFFRKSRQRWFVQLRGRQVNLGPDKDEAFKAYYKLMAEPEASPICPPQANSKHLVAALCDYFLEWVQRNRSPDTYEWYRYRLQRFIDLYPEMTSDQIRPYHVERWVDSYDLSITSRRNYFRSIKRCLKWATRQGYIDENPIEFLEVPSGERRDEYVPPSEFQTLLEYVDDSNLRDLLVTTYYTGCRPQESLRVQTRHVELERNRWVFPQKESKSKREPRIVYLSDEALQITERRINCSSPGTHLFTNSRGQPWTTEAVNCAFDRLQSKMGKKILKEQGICISASDIAAFIPQLNPIRRRKGKTVKKTPAELRCEAKRKLTGRLARKSATRYSLYLLRHSWATNALKRGVDSLTVAILMGHRDPSMLAKVYQHLGHNPEHMHEQAKRAAGGDKDAA